MLHSRYKDKAQQIKLLQLFLSRSRKSVPTGGEKYCNEIRVASDLEAHQAFDSVKDVKDEY